MKLPIRFYVNVNLPPGWSPADFIKNWDEKGKEQALDVFSEAMADGQLSWQRDDVLVTFEIHMVQTPQGMIPMCQLAYDAEVETLTKTGLFLPQSMRNGSKGVVRPVQPPE
jgi:hypothetical protein